MFQRYLHAAMIAPLLLSLGACGTDVKDEIAAGCIFDAVSPDLETSFKLMALGGQKMPNISMGKAKVKECVKSGPSTFDCLVEYSFHLDGDLPEFYMNMTGLWPDDDRNLNFMANWRFIMGTNGTRCQKRE